MIHQIETGDGVRLAAKLRPADGNAERAAILVHGYAGDMHEGGLFDKLAERAAAHGVVSLAYNWRGISPSEGDFGSTGMSRHLLDLEAVTRWMQERFPNLPRPMTAVGFSLGAAAVRLLIRRRPGIFRKPVFLGPAMRPNQSMWSRYNTSEMWQQIEANGFAVKPGSSVPLGRAALEMLRDTDCGERAFDIGEPVLVCHGTNDDRIPIANSREQMAQLAPGHQVTYVEIDGASHSFRPAEQREQVTEVVVDWLVA